MNRAEMVEKAYQVHRATAEVPPYSGSVCNTEEVVAAILDVILPQVTTVAELEALPLRTLLVSDYGNSFLISPDPHQRGRRFVTPQGDRWSADWVIRANGHVTVVWSPEVTS
jgi:hypothetical protein